VGEDEFAALHNVANDRLFAYVAVRLGYADAMDAVSEVFEVAWSKRLRAPGTVDDRVGWLFEIAKNKIREEMRRRRRRPHVSSNLDYRDPLSDHAEAIALADLGMHVYRSLSPSDRLLFDLLFIQEVGRDNACAKLNITMQALYTRASRLRSRIAALHEELAYVEGEPA
jgi:RNA polymerase sigma factor (sigma-70 family)